MLSMFFNRRIFIHAVRGIGYAFKAAYLTKCYRSATAAGEGGLFGAWLALTNAGFGIAIVAQCLILAAWCVSVALYLSPELRAAPFLQLYLAC